MIVQLS